jgi:Ni,Fe-hydrogenase III large subunit
MKGRLPIGPFDTEVRMPLLVEAELDGATVTGATLSVAETDYNHGLAFEGLSVRAGAALASHGCARSAIHHACAFCLAVEEAQGFEISEPYEAMRVTLSEWGRIASHLEVISDLARALEDDLVYGRPRKYITRIRSAFEALCGNPFGFGAVVPGGVEIAGEAGSMSWLDDIAAPLARDCRFWAFRFSSARTRLRKGRLARGALPDGALSAPAFRASGSKADVRGEMDASGAYERFGFEPVVRGGGTTLDRTLVLIGEIGSSLDIIAHASPAAAQLEGPVPEVLSGKGSSSGAWESPHGAIEYRVLLGSEGKVMRVRTSSAAEDVADAAPGALLGVDFADCGAALISFNMCDACMGSGRTASGG